jgi:hypothetical protein
MWKKLISCEQKVGSLGTNIFTNGTIPHVRRNKNLYHGKNYFSPRLSVVAPKGMPRIY